MIIRLKVFEQTLSIVDTKSIPRKGSKDYLVLQFTFSSDWKDLDKLCYLQSGEVSQPIEVVDNLVEVPEWFTQQDRFYVTLFGKSGSQEVPTNVVSLRLEKSNTLWEQDAPEPQPSWIVKLIDLNNHPPVPGNNGYWMLWDTDNGTYVESDLPLPDMSGIPDGGTAGQLLSKTESGTEWIDPPQSGVHPDWNQNDETAPDYIKNKPFYTGDPVETVLVEESTIQFIDIGGLFSSAIKSTFSPTVGNVYKISWDGTDYESTCVKVGQNTYIGNLSIEGSGPDTGEPFLMLVGNQEIDVATLDGHPYHTISISRFVPGVVVKIDPKYLPDNALNITGATVGQIAKITAVDDSGKPTAWEAVDDRLPNVRPSDNGKVLAVEQTGEFEYGYGFADIPNMYDFINLGITGASPGKLAKVKSVDDFGQPTAWEAVDMPSVQNWAKVNMTGSVGQFIAVSAVDDGGNVTAVAPVTIPNAEEASF